LASGKRNVASALGAVVCNKKALLPLPSGFEPCRLVKPASRVLLGLLVEAFVPEGPLVVGIDETLERRRGKQIAAKGIYRDKRLDLAIPTSSRGAL
jgi:hypothetical protein